MKRVSVLHFVLVVAALAWPADVRQAGAAAAESFVLIVHPENPAAEVDRDFVRDAFLKKASSWRGGESVRPVDLSRKFPAREQFTRDVLKKSMPQLKRYWSQQIFSGKGVPPPEVDSEKAMIAFVVGTRGAIGYLPAGTDPGGARIVKVK
jgi:ABC-type phosphate transport system substrate-binding protein